MGRGQQSAESRFRDIMGTKRGTLAFHGWHFVNGVAYNSQTPDEVIAILERSRIERLRLRLHYGDQETGRDWGDVYDVTGTIGLSSGKTRIPIIISNVRSMGGSAILDRCIVRIRHANRKDGGDLWRHPRYTPPPKEDYPDWDKHFA